MGNYIDKLLAYKKEKYKEKQNNIYKKNIEQYLDTCIAFIYDKKDENNLVFLKELKKFNIKKNDEFKIERKNLELNKENIFVISSDKCGLGKSYNIRHKIKENNQEYYSISHNYFFLIIFTPFKLHILHIKLM